MSVKRYKDFQPLIESCGGGGSISSCGGSSNSGHTSCGGSRVTSCGGGTQYSSSDSYVSGPSEDEIRRVRNARRRRNTNTPKICSECDVLTVASAKFCHNCGHEL
jgi:hypothetical protein